MSLEPWTSATSVAVPAQKSTEGDPPVVTNVRTGGKKYTRKLISQIQIIPVRKQSQQPLGHRSRGLLTRDYDSDFIAVGWSAYSVLN